MSRQNTERPGYRLLLGYPDVFLMREQSPEPIGSVRLDQPDYPQRMQELAEIVLGNGGRVRAVLPEAEIWRGQLDDAGGGPLRRRRRARALAANAMQMREEALAYAIGPQRADGSAQVAAVPRETVHDTRRFLASCGLRSAKVSCSGTMPAFRTRRAVAALDPLGSISFDIGSRGWQRAAMVGAAALALLVAGIGWQAGAPSGTGQEFAVALVSSPSPAPVATPPAKADSGLAAGLTRGPRPEPRPLALSFPARMAAIPAARSTAPAVRTTAPAPAPIPLVTMATRNLPGLAQAAAHPFAPSPLDKPAPATVELPASVIRPAELVRLVPTPQDTVRGVRVASTSPRPMRRPVPAGKIPAPAAAQSEPAQSEAAATTLGPRPRPAGVATGGDVRADVSRAVTEAVAVASVASPGATVTFTVPQPRRIAATPATKPAAAPVPKPVIKVAPQRVVRAAPQPVAAPATQRVVTVAPRTTTFKPQTAAVTRAAVVPASTQAVRATPKRKVAAANTRPAREQVGLQRRELSLVGVFGSGDQRRALVRLSNGRMQKVGPGDRVEGVQVAAVGSDSVRLTGGGRDTLLKLPD